MTRLRHSSSSRPSVMTEAPAPVRMVAIASTISVAPVPGVGFSIRCSGVGPSIMARRKPSSRSATAWARSAGEMNGKSPSRSSQISERAAAISSAVGCSGNRRHLEAGRRRIEQPRIRVVAGLGQQHAVAAEHRRGDDAGQHRQAGIGRRQQRLDQRRRRMRRHEVALAVHAPPDWRAWPAYGAGARRSARLRPGGPRRRARPRSAGRRSGTATACGWTRAARSRRARRRGRDRLRRRAASAATRCGSTKPIGRCRPTRRRAPSSSALPCSAASTIGAHGLGPVAQQQVVEVVARSGGSAIATSRPSARSRRAAVSAARRPAPEASWSARMTMRVASGGSCTCSRIGGRQRRPDRQAGT